MYRKLPYTTQVCVSYSSWPAPSVYLPPHESNRVFDYSRKGVCSVYCPASAIRRGSTDMGDRHSLQMLFLLHLFFLWIKHSSNQHLCWVLFGNSKPIEDAVGQGLWTPNSDGWHCNDFCHPPCSGNSQLGLVDIPAQHVWYSGWGL